VVEQSRACKVLVHGGRHGCNCPHEKCSSCRFGNDTNQCQQSFAASSSNVRDQVVPLNPHKMRSIDYNFMMDKISWRDAMNFEEEVISSDDDTNSDGDEDSDDDISDDDDDANDGDD
jgi:hypothetical protein